MFVMADFGRRRCSGCEELGTELMTRSTTMWTVLGSEILELIMKLLDLADISCLAAVCSPWRFAAKSYVIAERLSAQNMPGRVQSDNPSVTAACLIGAYKGLTEDQSRWCRGTLGLWLVVEVNHGDSRAVLLHAFLRNYIELPQYPKGIRSIKKAILLSPPTSSDSVVAAILNTGRLAYCTPADTTWTLCKAPQFTRDIAFYNSKLYAVDSVGSLWSFEINQSTKGEKLDVPVPSSWNHQNYTMLYLLESNGRLLMVMRHRCCTFPRADVIRDNNHIKFRTTDFQVFEMDASWESWVQVDGLPDQVLLLSKSHSDLLPAKQGSFLTANSIYFTDAQNLNYICKFEHGKRGITHIEWNQGGSIFFDLFSSSGLPSSKKSG